MVTLKRRSRRGSPIQFFAKEIETALHCGSVVRQGGCEWEDHWAEESSGGTRTSLGEGTRIL